MLRRLSVENYALIDSLTLELDPHLNIITGETGAGKSILLGALSLLLGAKNDGSARKDAARNCTVEGTFDLAGRGMEPFFAEHDLDYAAETTLTRIITPAGKSRSFINDVPVSLAELRELGSRLIDIHSQHQNLILSSEEFRTQALDTLAGNGPLLEQYTAQYARLTTLRRELAALREAAEAGRRDEEWLRFQNEELTAAALREGEQAETEQELAVLENAESISEAFTTLRNAFDADETGILAQLKQSENALGHLRAHYPAAGEYADRLHAVIEELKDINGGVTAASERLPNGCRSSPPASTCCSRSSRNTTLPTKPNCSRHATAAPHSWRPSSTATNASPRPKRPSPPPRPKPAHWPTVCTRRARRPHRSLRSRFSPRLPGWAWPRPFSVWSSRRSRSSDARAATACSSSSRPMRA